MTTLETDTIAVLRRVRDSVGDVATQWGEAKLKLDRLCRREFYGGWPSRDIAALVRKIDSGDKTGSFGGVGTQGCRDITGLLMQIRDSVAPAPPQPDHVADANARLSLTGISVGKHVIQDDNSTEYQYNGDAEAVQIIGAGTEAANGYYTKRGTHDGKPFFNKIGAATDATAGVTWDSAAAKWFINDEFANPYYRSADDVAYPWLVTTWSTTGPDSGSLPVPTTAHIASKNALTTCAFVSGAGTTAANGIYTERPALGEPVLGKKIYNLLGQLDEPGKYAIIPSFTEPYWRITDGGGTSLYISGAFDNVPYPWLATFSEDTGDSPAPTVVSKTQGELDAGVLVTGAGTGVANDVYPNSGNRANRSTYLGIANTLSIQYDPPWQINGADPSSSGDTAFPWEASFNDSATVAEDLIASESNWEPIP